MVVTPFGDIPCRCEVKRRNGFFHPMTHSSRPIQPLGDLLLRSSGRHVLYQVKHPNTKGVLQKQERRRRRKPSYCFDIGNKSFRNVDSDGMVELVPADAH